MDEATGTTRASGIEYPYRVKQFESLAEAVEVMDGGEESVLENLNSLQDQNGKQGPKGTVRTVIDAARAAGWSDEEIQDHVNGIDGSEDPVSGDALADLLDDGEIAAALTGAVRYAQDTTSEYTLGRPRSTSDGPLGTKKAQQQFGAKVAEKYSDEELAALMDELGIDDA